MSLPSWHYKIHHLPLKKENNFHEMHLELDKLGLQGWEAVTIGRRESDICSLQTTRPGGFSADQINFFGLRLVSAILPKARKRMLCAKCGAAEDREALY